jgi:hypothetical protein
MHASWEWESHACPLPMRPIILWAQERMWWRDAHLFWQPSSTQAAVLSSAADPAMLTALAAVDAFLQSLRLWQALPISR